MFNQNKPFWTANVIKLMDLRLLMAHNNTFLIHLCSIIMYTLNNLKLLLIYNKQQNMFFVSYMDVIS